MYLEYTLLKTDLFNQEYNHASVCLFVCLFSIIPIVNANSHETNNLTIESLIDSSDLVFQGSVIKVDYQESTAGINTPAVPHTFVTYSISSILSGSYSDDTITLRFVGGPKSSQPDVVLLPSSFPLFNEGDEDILFVVGNTVRACPLVGCSAGRLRIVNNNLYDNEGAELGLSNRSKLDKTGRFSSEKAFSERTIGINKFGLIFSPDESSNTQHAHQSDRRSAKEAKTNNETKESAIDKKAINPSDFLVIVKEASDSLAQNRRKAPAALLSATIGLPFQYSIGQSTPPNTSAVVGGK